MHDESGNAHATSGTPSRRWPQEIFFENERGRIVGMGSLGYVDDRNDVTDVIIGASHGSGAAVRLALPVRPRGIIAHDACATIGKDQAGAQGLALLDTALIAGATVDGTSARISDPVDMYQNGIISFANRTAGRLGIAPGMFAMQAAMRMLNGRLPLDEADGEQHEVYNGPLGRVLALDTVKYIDQRISGSVLCLGSHASYLMPRYLADYGFPVRGVIANDCGPGKGAVGSSGLPELDKIAIPAATVSVTSARVGDGRSTYFDGRISAVNESARCLGIAPGDTAVAAAELMLKAR